jgi:hypothetical protein
MARFFGKLIPIKKATHHEARDAYDLSLQRCADPSSGSLCLCEDCTAELRQWVEVLPVELAGQLKVLEAMAGK